MRILYTGLKRIFRYSIQQYFSSIKVLNKKNVPQDKPLLILPNHRSAFMDPLVVATLLKPEMHFLARGESFTNKRMARIFSKLNMIPIYRREHTPDDVHKNEDVFRYCFELLEQKGALMIYPEGLCQTQFILAPLKSGTARIALGAEAKNMFNLDVHLVPVGINYSHPHMFRSAVVIDIGKAIPVKAYQKLYETDAQKAIDELTADIDSSLRKLVVILDHPEDSDLMRHIEVVLAHEDVLEPAVNESWYHRRMLIANGINIFRLHQGKNVDEFAGRIKRYVHRAGLVDPASVQPKDVFEQLNVNHQGLKLFLLIVGLPIFMLGMLTHGIAFYLVNKATGAMVKRSDFTGSVLLALGLLIFSIFGITETILLYQFGASWTLCLIFLIFWPTLGLMAYGYYVMAYQYLQKLRAKYLIRKRKQLHLDLERERNNILSVLKKSYWSFLQNT